VSESPRAESGQHQASETSERRGSVSHRFAATGLKTNRRIGSRLVCAAQLVGNTRNLLGVQEAESVDVRSLQDATPSVVIADDPLDQLDDAAPERGILDLHERLGKRQSVRSREEVAHVTRRRRGALSDWYRR
jgi:hypothetical protein